VAKVTAIGIATPMAEPVQRPAMAGAECDDLAAQNNVAHQLIVYA
jgi:hypothetical protein